MRVPNALLAAAAAIALLGATQRPALAQFYEKVDLGDAAVERLVDACDGSDPAIGALVATLARCGDPGVRKLFESMARSGNPAARIYGVLGAALAGESGIDPTLYALLADREERAAVIREANVTGIIRKSPVPELLAAGDLPAPALLSLIAETGRRGEPWSTGQLAEFAAGTDPVAAGFASLLLREGSPGSGGDPAAWRAFRSRLASMDAPERWLTLRGLVEACLLFELGPAMPELLAETAADGTPDDLRAAAVGAALRLAPKEGLVAWRAQVAANRSQRALVRSAMQLLAAAGPSIPAEAFDEVRNGNEVLGAIADAGAARCKGDDPVPTLLTLLDSGHSSAAEWALVRAGELPPDRSAPVWKHLLATVEGAPPGADLQPALMTGLSRELMRSDPSAVRRLLDRFADSEALTVALMAGVLDSRAPQGQDVARERRGRLPRTGEGVAVLILARADAPMTDADLEVLGRAAAGGGGLDPGRTVEAAWYVAKRRGTVGEAAKRISGATGAAGAPG